MFPFSGCHKKRMTDDEKIASLKPGERYVYTSGVAAHIEFIGEKCGICGQEFQYEASASMAGFNLRPIGPYWYQKFGQYKPQTLWYCRSHSNKDIEAKIKELDV